MRSFRIGIVVKTHWPIFMEGCDVVTTIAIVNMNYKGFSIMKYFCHLYCMQNCVIAVFTIYWMITCRSAINKIYSYD